MFDRKTFVLFSLFVLVLAACGGRTTPTPALTSAPIAVPDNEPLPAETDISGTWTGEMNELVGGFTCTVNLTLNQAADMSVTGNINLVCPSTNELYDLSGTFDGTTLHLQEASGRYFTATLSGESLTGFIAWNVYDDSSQAWGQFSLVPEGAVSSGEVNPPGDLISDPQGTWVGMMEMFDGVSVFSRLVLASQTNGGWDALFSWVFPSYGYVYVMFGTLNNGVLNLQDSTAAYSLSASIQQGRLSGYLAPGCFDCLDQATGTFTLDRIENDMLTPTFQSSNLDLNGTWNGTIIFNREFNNMYSMSATFTQATGSTDINGQVTLVDVAGGATNNYQVNGQISDPDVYFDTALTEEQPYFFWGEFIDHGIYGFMSDLAYDLPEDASAIFYIYKP